MKSRKIQTVSRTGMIDSTLIQAESVVITNNSCNFCMVCSDSPFSKHLSDGAREYFSTRDDAKLKIEFFSKNEYAENSMMRFLEENSNDYNGFIIRPLHNSDSLLDAIKTLLNKNKTVILLDINLDNKQLQFFNHTYNFPFFIGADLDEGGKLIAQTINNLVIKYKKENTLILLFLGPHERSTSRKRGKSILWYLGRDNNHDICKIIMLPVVDTFPSRITLVYSLFIS